MSKIWNSLKISFSMYSKIPVPQADWTGDNMRYVMCFFPLVGLVLGAVMYGVQWGFTSTGDTFGKLFQSAILTVIPIFVTGGIHVDGFLDTSDALSSYQERDRRLEILKDSHAGAFAIICGITYFVMLLGAYSMIDQRSIGVIACGFVLSRAMSGLSVVTFPMAKKTGLAATFSDAAKKRTTRIWMVLWICLAVAAMLMLNWHLGVLCILGAAMVFVYYHHMAMKNFGGINGDLCGWFLMICELVIALMAVVGGVLWN